MQRLLNLGDVRLAQAHVDDKFHAIEKIRHSAQISQLRASHLVSGHEHGHSHCCLKANLAQTKLGHEELLVLPYDGIANVHGMNEHEQRDSLEDLRHSLPESKCGGENQAAEDKPEAIHAQPEHAEVHENIREPQHDVNQRSNRRDDFFGIVKRSSETTTSPIHLNDRAEEVALVQNAEALIVEDFERLLCSLAAAQQVRGACARDRRGYERTPPPLVDS